MSVLDCLCKKTTSTYGPTPADAPPAAHACTHMQSTFLIKIHDIPQSQKCWKCQTHTTTPLYYSHIQPMLQASQSKTQSLLSSSPSETVVIADCVIGLQPHRTDRLAMITLRPFLPESKCRYINSYFLYLQVWRRQLCVHHCQIS